MEDQSRYGTTLGLKTSLVPDDVVYVSDLIEQGLWKRQILNQFFSEIEIKEILKIPIPLQSRADQWSWHFTKDGAFSVKSAYYVALNERRKDRASTSHPMAKGFWSVAWGIWLRQNAWVFSRKKWRLQDVIGKAMSLIGEYEKANQVEKGMAILTSSPSHWRAPEVGWYKLNVDVATFEDGTMGIGAIV